jgi:hypothetical protein
MTHPAMAPTDDELRRLIARRDVFHERRGHRERLLAGPRERRATCDYCLQAGDHQSMADCLRARERRDKVIRRR